MEMWVTTSSPLRYLSSGGRGAVSREGFVFNTVETVAAPISSVDEGRRYILSRNIHITRKKERKAIVEVAFLLLVCPLPG